MLERDPILDGLVAVRFRLSLWQRFLLWFRGGKPFPNPSALVKDAEESFAAVQGKKGERKRVRAFPQCIFRGEKFVTADSAEGVGTRIVQVWIGMKPMLPIGDQPDDDGILSRFLDKSALGNGMRFDTCMVGQAIAVDVLFLRDCMWEGATLFGKALGG